MTVDDLPDGVEDGALLQEGFPEDAKPSLDSQEVQHALLCRTVAGNENEAHSQVEEALRKLGVKIIVDVWTLSTDTRRMVRSERRKLQSISAGDVSLHGSFMAFKRGNAQAKEQARRIIALGVTRKTWQFWR